MFLKPFKYSMEYNIADDDTKKTINSSTLSLIKEKIPENIACRIDEKSNGSIEEFTKLVQNFPLLYGNSLPDSNINYTDSSEYIIINGKEISEELSPFTITEIIFEEEKRILKIKKKFPNLTKKQVQLLSSISHDNEIKVNLTVDFWVNNLETDNYYKRWLEKSVKDVLKPTSKNNVRYIAKNLYNFVIGIDMSKRSDLINGINIWNKLSLNAPIRLGFKLTYSNPSGKDAANVLLYLIKNKSSFKAYEFLQNLLKNHQINKKLIKKLFNGYTTDDKVEIPNLIDDLEENLKNIPITPFMSINGKIIKYGSGNLGNFFYPGLLKAQKDMKEYVLKGIITDKDKDIYLKLMEIDSLNWWDSKIFSLNPKYLENFNISTEPIFFINNNELESLKYPNFNSLKYDKQLVVVYGRIFELQPNISKLIIYEEKRIVNKIKKYFLKNDLGKICSFIGLNNKDRIWKEPKSDLNEIVIESKLNPLNPDTQYLSFILKKIKEIFNIEIKLIISKIKVNSEIDELLVNRFYRYQLDLNRERSKIEFPIIPKGITFSLIEDIPDEWMIEKIKASHDLDNIVNGMNVDSIFQLKGLIISGYIDSNNLKPGTMITSGNKKSFIIGNYGYWQLSLSPGFYKINPLGGYKGEIKTSIKEWIPLPLIHEIHKKSHVVDSEEKFDNKNDSSINVFFIVSGHLYERLARIAMLSIIKNTKRPVNFYLLSNYLSPNFKDLLPKMANFYNFQYEFVTYKWPPFLFKQNEKNRIMWAYKILFLDVLFPSNVHRIIYLDADNIVRTDLGELMDMDLKGASIGMTPFCDNKPDIDGFRFWKKGFWKSTLQELPYHISALYIVDIDKFRELEAGDIYRNIYNRLAPDKDSLSNLDQDLPNYAQRQVKIFHLPQEWLWCETWCSMDSLKFAKTIDLCNNPMTKEPKLDVAKRTIKEWELFNKEVINFELNNNINKNVNHMEDDFELNNNNRRKVKMEDDFEVYAS